MNAAGIAEICVCVMHICMNFAAMTFDWNQARAFLVTAETGSFSAAARELNMTQPTLGRQVAGLEDALDLVLFERIGRKLALTPAGQDLLEHMRVMGEAANRASLIASGRAESVAGDVCVSVTDMFAHYVMPVIVADLRRLAPQIRIQVLASNDLSDLQRREADIAVRHVAPTQPELISRKVREGKGRLYASQAYIDRKGPFDTVASLAAADFIAMGDEREMLHFMQNWGLPITKDHLRVLTDSGLTGWEMGRAGLGVTAMMDDLAVGFQRIRLVYDRLGELLSAKDLPMRVG